MQLIRSYCRPTARSFAKVARELHKYGPNARIGLPSPPSARNFAA